MRDFYEARPGVWLLEGVSWEDHQRAIASNWDGGSWEKDILRCYVEEIIYRNDEARVWVTRDERRIPYDQLTESHLNNIIAMLERNGKSSCFPRLMEMAGGSS